jgi:membrane protein implicated in regulation of membrane protease activity
MEFKNFIDFFTNTNPLIESTNVCFWLVIAIFFLIMEMGSPGLFFFISFFFGGLVAAVMSFFTPSISIQTVCFLSGTGVASLVLRYWIVPMIGKDRHHERTNVYALKGKQGFVVKGISFEHPGLVRINGEIWVAKIARDGSVVKGDLIEVVEVRGAHVIVKKA